jgi:prepilin-type N-terminal cleavage/methylation domain-containing protein
MGKSSSHKSGFTLIELSIVLVIIGLIVGGVLVGQDLIRAASVRATISQIERYNTAVNTFQTKYGDLPGDMTATTATTFGFSPRSSGTGQGDGNGILQGVYCDAGTGCSDGWAQAGGETGLFWVDLSTANGLNVNLVDGAFSTATWHAVRGSPTPSSSPSIDAYMPQAKLGRGNYVYVWSGGWLYGTTPLGSNGINYFGLSAISVINAGGSSEPTSTAGLTVQEAYSIDKKADDGLPQTGHITALYVSGYGQWMGASDTSATAGDATTCYDNGNVNGVVQQYSVSQNGGTNVNCALSFQFQ